MLHTHEVGGSSPPPPTRFHNSKDLSDQVRSGAVTPPFSLAPMMRRTHRRPLHNFVNPPKAGVQRGLFSTRKFATKYDSPVAAVYVRGTGPFSTQACAATDVTTTDLPAKPEDRAAWASRTGRRPSRCRHGTRRLEGAVHVHGLSGDERTGRLLVGLGGPATASGLFTNFPAGARCASETLTRTTRE